MPRRRIKEPADLPPAPSNENAEIARTGTLPSPAELAPAKGEKAPKPDLAPFAKGEMPETIRREWADFMQVATLMRRAGCPVDDLAMVAFKEMVDNAYDVSPKGGVEMTLNRRTLSVHDRGPGLTGDRALRIFDITRPSLSSKRWRMARRGALGNGSRVVMGVAHVSGGYLTVEARGVGQELTVGPNGATQVRRRFHSEVKEGTRVSLTLGPMLEFDVERIKEFARSAGVGAGNAFGGTKAMPAWFDAPAVRELIRDAPEEMSVMDFAKLFDLTDAALAEIKATAMRTTTAGLLNDVDKLGEIVEAILGGQKSQRELNRHGRNALPGSYAHEEITIRLGGAALPAVVEVWIEGKPVPDKKKDGKVATSVIFVNRTPALMEAGAGHVDAGSKQFDLWFGQRLFRVTGVLKGPCNFVVALAITAPELPLVSDGKAIDLGPFHGAISRAIRTALPRAYVPAKGKVAPPAAKSDMPSMSVKDAVYQVIVEAYTALAAGDIGAPPRMLFYNCRPKILALTGRDDLNYATFKAAVHDFMEDHPDETGDWSILYDDRGHFAAPGHISFGLGTRAVEDYISGLGHRLPEFTPGVGSIKIEHYGPSPDEGNDPSHSFSAVVFIEKEGYSEMIAKAGIARRFQVAFASTKGLPNTAIRRLLDKLAEFGIKVFVLHDLDINGMNIVHSLRTTNERYQFENKIELIDMGVRLADAEQLELESEPFKLDHDRTDLPKLRERLRRYGATENEISLLVDQKRRVEIDAMGSPQRVIDFIERKLTEHGVCKVVPPDAVMEHAYQHKVADLRIKEAMIPLRAQLQRHFAAFEQQLKDDGVLNVDVTGVADRVRARIEDFPDRGWRAVVDDLAKEDELWAGENDDDEDDEDDDA